MPKAISKFVCQHCGYESSGWLGKCPNCGEWGSLVETVVEREPHGLRDKREGREIEAIELARIKPEKLARISTGISELDRVLGGGLVRGQVVLLAGEPGIGKSTLLSQVCDKTALPNKNYSKLSKKRVFYISGEESADQIKLRTKRLGLKGNGILLLEETDTDRLADFIEKEGPDLVIVDSIQTLTTQDLTGLAGSVGQVRESAFRLSRICKAQGIPLFLVGHVTKEGQVAGPRVLEHLVDTVLWFEGEVGRELRILRAIKNRFGATDEVGIFTMEEEGLVSVDNPSQFFLSKTTKVASGSVTTVILEGSRPVLVEIQALVVPTKLVFPKRSSQGIDPRRLELLIAVLTRRASIPLYSFDIFVNAAGGIRASEPAGDLAISLAIASAWANKVVDKNLAAFGEVGLLGEVRKVFQEKKRITEARRLGFRKVVTADTVTSVGEAIKRYIK